MMQSEAREAGRKMGLDVDPYIDPVNLWPVLRVYWNRSKGEWSEYDGATWAFCLNEAAKAKASIEEARSSEGGA